MLMCSRVERIFDILQDLTVGIELVSYINPMACGQGHGQHRRPIYESGVLGVPVCGAKTTVKQGRGLACWMRAAAHGHLALVRGAYLVVSAPVRLS